MRQILNISLPFAMLKDLKKEVKNGKYASVSEFIRFLIRDYQERKLAKEFEKARKEFDEGKSIKIKSLKDLMD